MEGTIDRRGEHTKSDEGVEKMETAGGSGEGVPEDARRRRVNMDTADHRRTQRGDFQLGRQDMKAQIPVHQRHMRPRNSRLAQENRHGAFGTGTL